MIYSEIWRDVFYDFADGVFDYAIFADGNMIFRGRAIKNPSAVNGRVNVSKLCRDWLDITIPDFETDGFQFSRQYREFSLQSISGDTFVPLEDYGFILNYSYESGWTGDEMILSEPINGRMDSRMKLVYSVFKDTTGQTICEDDVFIQKMRIMPSVIYAPYPGVSVTVQVISNYDYSASTADSWLHISPASGQNGTTSMPKLSRSSI